MHAKVISSRKKLTVIYIYIYNGRKGDIMKSIIKLSKVLLLLVLSGIILSCEHNTSEPEKKKCTITFYANDGSDAFETQEVEYGKSTALRKNTFENNGFVFAGWSLEDDLTQVRYADETTVAIKNDISLYAVWKEKKETVRITFWANTSSDDTKTVIQNVEKNTPVKLRANSFTKEGYTFIGWMLDRENTSEDYLDKAEVTINENLNLYALWLDTENTGTVILHSNTQDDETVSLYFPYNEIKVYTLPADIFVREGYRIEGWSSEPDAKAGLLSSNSIQPSLVWQFEKKTIHYYCIWQKEAAYTLTFYPNYEGAEAAPVQKEYERTDFTSNYARFKIFEPFLFTREGYELVGWATAPDSSYLNYTVTYHGAESDSFMHDTTLYAVWEEANSSNLIHYTYYKNDEKAETQDEEKIVVAYKKSGYKIGLAPVVFTWDGMVFEGWKTVRDRSDNNYSTNPPLYQTNTYSSSTDTSYYAMWHVEKPVITFKANVEGEGYEDYVVITNYKENQMLPECQWTREGYGFVGWSKNKDDNSSNAYKPGRTYTPEENTIYYAIWQKNPVITFHANYDGAQEEDKTQTVPYNVSTPIADITFTRSGYFFMGYTASPTSSYSSYYSTINPGDTVKLTNDADYYAVWAKKRTIIYNSNYSSGQQSLVSDIHPEGQEFYTREECPFEAPEGYYFAGWSSVNNSTYHDLYSRKVTRYTFSSSNENDYHVYATWLRYQNVHFISNYNGSGSRDKVLDYRIKIGEKIYITQELVDQFTAPQGKSFWCFGQHNVINVPSTISSNVYYELGGEFSYGNDDFSGDFNLYAQWKGPITVTLVANFEGATPASKTVTIPFGTHLTDIEFQEEWDRSESKYHFWGWSTNINQSTTYSPSDSYVVFDNSRPIYAIWLNPVKYTYHYNYGDSEEVYEDLAEQKYSYYLLDNMFTPPEGKKFKCWCYKPDENSGTTRNVGFEVTSYYNTKDTDFYAIWENE